MYSYGKDSIGNTHLVETLGHPLVYLDSWALYEITEKSSKTEKFINCMQSANGTLRISAFTVLELFKRNNEKEVEKVLELVDAVDSSFMNANFEEVLRIEEQAEMSRISTNAASDLKTVSYYVQANNFPEIIKTTNVVRHCLPPERALAEYEDWVSLAEEMSQRFERSRNIYDSEKLKAKAESLRAKGLRSQAATYELSYQAYIYILRQGKMKLGANDFLDLFHAIVPASYCEFVLIDGRWAEFLKQTGLKSPDIARVFTGKTFDVFFLELEAYCNSIQCKSESKCT